MAQTSEKPKFSLRLVVDEEKNKVVFAEAGADFVDVLCSLLTLPMGTIVRLLEKHQKSQFSTAGCFHNLYKSVSDMDVDNFETQACKHVLLHPRSIMDNHCTKLKLNVNDTTDATKFFVCPNFYSKESCSKIYSNFHTSMCSCGQSMSREMHLQEGENVDGFLGNAVDGVFVSCRTSYIITDDLKVALNSMGVVLIVLNDLGYAGFDKLREMLLDVGFEEVLTLLACLFTSETPLTDIFLKNHCMSRKHKMLSPLLIEDEVPDQFLTLKVFVKKVDKSILYAECREDFVDFLFTFLAIPLGVGWELSVDAANMGCIGNLCRSVKGLSFKKLGQPSVAKFVLPHYYNLSTKLLDISIQEPPEYECLLGPNGYSIPCCNFTKKVKAKRFLHQRIAKFTTVDPKCPYRSIPSSKLGFVKGETNFIVSDDLTVTPMRASSTFSLLSKWQMKISDIEEQVIKVNRAEAISLLRASLITTSALTNAFSSFLSKSKIKTKKATRLTYKIPKSEETH